MNTALAEAIAPFVIAGIESVLKKEAPKLEATIEKYLPTVEKIVCILQCEDPAKVQAELVQAQYDAIAAAVTAQIAAQP